MIAAWMLYAIAVGTLLAAAAWVADAACRLLRRPRRGVWAAALAGTVAAPLAAPVLGAVRRPASPAPAPAPSVALGAEAPAVARGATRAPRAAAPGAPARRVPRAAWLAIGPSHPLRALDRPLVALWLAAAAASAAALAVGARRLARARRGWLPLGTAADVLVAESYGPAVAGVRRPVIVVPRWALALTPDDLALAHERAHVAARDPLLLTAALAALAAMPWLLPLWLVVARLRLAVESDCDRRVLRRHPDAVRYGRLLLDVAERMRPTARRTLVPYVGGAPALLDPPRMLEARIRGLVAPAPGRGAYARATGLLAAAAGAATLACVAPRPQREAEAIAGPAHVADSLASQRATIDSLRARVATLTARIEGAAARGARRDPPMPAPMPPDATPPRSTTSPPPRGTVAPTESELHAAIARAAPSALTGAMGRQPLVWIVLDTAGGVAQSATGVDGMLTQHELRTLRRLPDGGPFSHLPDTARVLDTEGVYRTFPSLREAQLHSFGWERVPAGTDTVQVIWVRPTSLGWQLSDFAEAPRDAAGTRRPQDR